MLKSLHGTVKRSVYMQLTGEVSTLAGLLDADKAGGELLEHYRSMRDEAPDVINAWIQEQPDGPYKTILSKLYVAESQLAVERESIKAQRDFETKIFGRPLRRTIR